MKRIYTILAIAALLVAGCKPNLTTTKPVAGTATFSKYLAVGTNFTAGFADNSLCRSGQQNSYPAILAAQFSQVGGGNFVQPLLPKDAGFPMPKLVLGIDTDCIGPNLTPINYTIDTLGCHASVALQGPFNNVGVPGIKCTDYLSAGYGNTNPWSIRFFTNPATETPLVEALRLGHTFFSCWLGPYDVLAYAIAGGIANVPGTGPQDISDSTVFRTVYNTVVDSLTKNGAKGVLINIPSISYLPLFNAIAPKGLVLDAPTAVALNTQWALYSTMNFQAGSNYFVITDYVAGNQITRQIYPDEFILLTANDSIKCAGWGSRVPIPTKYVLTRAKVANITAYTNAYNQAIQAAAAKYNLAYADINAFIASMQKGIAFNGVNFSTQYIAGGAFSLDGLHFTPKGYALIANEIIRNINNTYHSTIPYADVNAYNGIKFP